MSHPLGRLKRYGGLVLQLLLWSGLNLACTPSTNSQTDAQSGGAPILASNEPMNNPDLGVESSTDGEMGEIGGSNQADETTAELDASVPMGGAPIDEQADATVDAMVDRRPLMVNSVIPNRGPTTGGQMIRVIGAGFSDDVTILLAGRECLNPNVESPNEIRCVTPEGLPGSIPVSAQRIDEGQRETAEQDAAYTYFEPVKITAVEPTRVPARGGIRVTVRGDGLVDGSRIVVDGEQIQDIEIDVEDKSITFTAPPHAPGNVDVGVTNFNGDATAPGAITYYEDLIIERVVPPFGPALGGTEVKLNGSGLTAGSLVTFVPNIARVGEASADRSTLDVESPPGVAGPVNVVIENDNGSYELPSGFVYFNDLANGFQVAGLVPNRGPLEGGNDIWIAGNGFTNATTVNIGGRVAACERLSANGLRCTAPPGMAGTVAVTVTEGADTVDIVGGYTYFQAVELIAIEPDHGSIAGGTLVTMTGTGFGDGMQIILGEAPLVDIQVLTPNRAVGIAPPNTAGPVDVIAFTEESRSVIVGGYRYFDPAADFGGLWGEPIESAVNVTVIHGGNGSRIEEAAVLATSPETGVTVNGITNMNGQVTLAEDGLNRPLNVTAAKEGFEATTIEDVMVENVTIILFPNDGEGEPPEPIPLPILQGVITGLDELPKPVNESVVNVIVVETSHSSPYNRTRLPEPGPGGLLYEDGPFAIMARPGELAVIATAGSIRRSAIANYQAGAISYWEMRRSLLPISMGMRRFVSASPGEEIGGLDVRLDHPLDLVIPVDLDNPPRGPNPGPQRYAVLPRLNLGAEGYWELDTQAESLDATLNLRRMPRLDGWDQDIRYFMIGFAYSTTRSNRPYSVCLEETRNVDGGLFIGPFVGSTTINEPEENAPLAAGRRVSWTVHEGIESPDIPITPPSANLILVEEPAFGPPKPLWRYVTPSDVTSFIFPELPEAAGGAGLGQGMMFLTIQPFIIEGLNFDFEDFTYDALNMGRWKAWSSNMTSFQRGAQ